MNVISSEIADTLLYQSLVSRVTWHQLSRFPVTAINHAYTWLINQSSFISYTWYMSRANIVSINIQNKLRRGKKIKNKK